MGLGKLAGAVAVAGLGAALTTAYGELSPRFLRDRKIIALLSVNASLRQENGTGG